MRQLLLIAMATVLLSCKGNTPVAKIAPGTLLLQKSNSKLSATAIKNESVSVELRFSELEGTLSLNPLKASVGVVIDSLETGDKTRDANIKTLFFDAALYKKAVFELTKLEGDPTTLNEGDSFAMKGEGTLNIRGGSVKLSGPLMIKRLNGGAYSATFKDLWVVNIKDAGMLDMLANLNKNCPQPHRVGLDVKLQGELVFVKSL